MSGKLTLDEIRQLPAREVAERLARALGWAVVDGEQGSKVEPYPRIIVTTSGWYFLRRERGGTSEAWNPLTDPAAAVEVTERFRLTVQPFGRDQWCAKGGIFATVAGTIPQAVAWCALLAAQEGQP